MAIKFLNTVAVDTDVLYVDASSNNVGIGTTSPNHKLQVEGGSAESIINLTTTGYANGLDIIEGTDGHAAIWLRENSYMHFGTNGVERMRITSSGNVGIGTTSPLYKLDVASGNSSNAFGLSLSGTARLKMYADGTYNYYAAQSGQSHRFTTTGGAEFLIANGGNVGIGTTSPGQKLDVSGNIRGNNFYANDSSVPSFYMERGDGLPQPVIRLVKSNDNLLIGHNAIDEVIFYDDAGEAMRLDGSGNLGIGTTSPTYKLDVAGNIRVDSTSVAQIFLDSAASNDAVLNFHENASQKGKIGYDTSLGGFGFVAGSGAFSTADMVLLDSGNVGIGTTNPAQNFVVADATNGNGVELVPGATATIQTYNRGTASYNNLNIDTASTRLRSTDYTSFHNGSGFPERMRITSSGNVGIGTTSPTQAKLVVNTTSLVASAFGRDGTDGDVVQIYNGLVGSTKIIALGASGNDGTIYSQFGNLLLQPSAGNVGIGTTSPSTKLEVISAANEEGIAIKDASNNLKYKVRQFGGNTYSSFWNASNVEQVRITSGGTSYFNGGNVGINKTAPAARLHVNGSTIITLPSTANFFKIEGDVDNNLFYAKNDSIGIGTTSPDAKLHLKDVNCDIITEATTVGNSARLRLKTTYGEYRVGSHNSSYWVYDSVAGSYRMWINSSGNVGIGTTSPAKNLNLEWNSSSVNPETGEGLGGGTSGKGVLLKNSNTTVGTFANLDFRANNVDARIAVTYNATNNGDFHFILDSPSINTPQTRLFIEGQTGNVGIGTTSPEDKLHVSQGSDAFRGITIEGTTPALYLKDTQATNAYHIGANGNYLYFLEDSNQSGDYNNIMAYWDPSNNFIFNTGKVGIGTTSPNYKLDVGGGARAGGKVTYTKLAGSLDTTGYAVAGLTTSNNGNSAGFTFTCFGHGGYQKVVYSCYNVSGTWNTIKVIDEGTNAFDVEASANAATITFTFKSTSGTKYYTPRVTVEATGSGINSTYA